MTKTTYQLHSTSYYHINLLESQEKKQTNRDHKYIKHTLHVLDKMTQKLNLFYHIYIYYEATISLPF